MELIRLPKPEEKVFVVRKLTGKTFEVRANEYFFCEGYLHFTTSDSDVVNRMLIAGKMPGTVFSIRRSKVESIELKGVVSIQKKRRVG
jgi:hypothetical protein